MVGIRTGGALSVLRSGTGRSILLAAMFAQGNFGGMYFMAKSCRGGTKDDRYQQDRQECMKW
jgi:hypothetical protein